MEKFSYRKGRGRKKVTILKYICNIKYRHFLFALANDYPISGLLPYCAISPLEKLIQIFSTASEKPLQAYDQFTNEFYDKFERCPILYSFM